MFIKYVCFTFFLTIRYVASSVQQVNSIVLRYTNCKVFRDIEQHLHMFAKCNTHDPHPIIATMLRIITCIIMYKLVQMKTTFTSCFCDVIFNRVQLDLDKLYIHIHIQASIQYIINKILN